MKRDFAQLGTGPFDVLVIGGGVYGAWIAYDAALRGLRVALVEQNDWGSGTSQSSSKLIHGGLRYLEHLKFGLVQRALRERRRLATLAPHRVHPLRFGLPVYRGDRVGRLRLEAGLWLYDRLAGNHQPVAPHTRMSRDEARKSWPFLTDAGLRGAFTYGDCGTDDARFTLEVVAGAESAGAVCVNHAPVEELVRENGKIVGAVVTDAESGAAEIVRASVTVNVTGPWATGIKGLPEPARGLARMVKGVHLILPPLPTNDAFLLTARRDGRVFFVIPWYGQTLLGTTDTDYVGDPGRVEVTGDDIEYLLTEANRALGGSLWSDSDVRGGFAGVRTLRNSPDASPTDVTREWSLEAPEAGLLIPIGGKLTSARAEAGIVAERAGEMVGRSRWPGRTRKRSFPWAPAGDNYPAWESAAMVSGTVCGMDPETARQAARRYGTTVAILHARLKERPELARRIVPDLPFCRGEVVHAARHEMARTLSDILRRRVPVSILARLDAGVLEDAAALAGEVLGWDVGRIRREAAGEIR
ncbi:MAG: FAD-dependent oxidoreductase [Leptospirillia bacterium]